MREKRKIAINIIQVNNGKLETRERMYSNERMGVLRREHGFLEYLDETFTAPDPIMMALINRHNVDKVLVGGEAVHNSLERKDLIEYLSTRESSDRRPGKQASCFFYTYKNSSFKYTNTVSRYSGEIGTNTDDIGDARLLRPGSDPGVKDQLAETIQKAEDLIAKLKPEVDATKEKLDKMNDHGQSISKQFKEAKRTKTDYNQHKMKLANQRDKFEEAKENASKDNDKEKAKKVSKIKKLVENSITMTENAAKTHNEVMKNTHNLTGTRMSENGLSDSLRKLADQLNEKKAETAELANQYNAADADYNTKKNILRDLLKKAEEIAPKEEWMERLEQEDLPNDLEGLEDALDEAENKVSSITDNPHVMRQYEERKKDIAKLQEQLDEVGGEKDMKKKQLETKLERWESALINVSYCSSCIRFVLL